MARPSDATPSHPTPPGPDWLFCPGHRAERFAKAAAAASGVIVDLEDGVNPADKAEARANLRGLADELDPARVVVRVNGAGTEALTADLDALRDTPLRTIMLPKAESPDQLEALAGFGVLALCETPRGILRAPEIALAGNCLGMMWGSEDLAAALGATGSRRRDSGFHDHARYARTSVHYAAAAAGRLAIDAVYLDIPDTAGLAREAGDAAADGWDVKAVIHPSHCAVVRRAFAPSAEELAQARRVVEAAAGSAHGAFSLDGRHIDEPLVRQARRVLARGAAATGPAAAPG